MGHKAQEIVGLDLNDLLKDLNKAYCDEWLAYHAYKHVAMVVSGPGYEDMAEFLNKTADLEQEHAGELAERITQLGGLPFSKPSEFEAHANYPYPDIPEKTDDYDAIIDMVTGSEAHAIEVYQRLIQKTMGKDNATYQLISHIQGEEIQHEELFENLRESRSKAKSTIGEKRIPAGAGAR
jgi:bacterioferritin